MGLIRDTWNWLTEPLETRAIDSFTDHPGLTEQLMAVQGLTPRPWRVAGLREAMGIPAVFRAVTLLSNVAGSLVLEAFRNGQHMDTMSPAYPRIVKRPNPFTTPRDFWRDTVYSMATRGEALWWIAARDSDGVPVSLLTLNPAEVKVDNNERDPRFPIYRWRRLETTAYSAVATGGDIVHITYSREPGALRGIGPLQMCGAAVSVAVEAQEWAANFFASGGIPSVKIMSKVNLDKEEADRLKAQWVESPSNLPKVMDPTVDAEPFEVNPRTAQLQEARNYSSGDVARMFGVPASLLEYNVPGSSLTYTNVEMEWTKFLRGCLDPYYLEPIEQAFSDLLTRSTTAEFNRTGLLRADSKARAERFKILVEAGVMTPEEARREEGLDGGSVETAPVPPSPPQAVPSRIPRR